jgi:hypothetical protein
MRPGLFKLAWTVATMLTAVGCSAPAQAAETAIVLHAARLLEVDSGRLVAPAEVLIVGERIQALGS